MHFKYIIDYKFRRNIHRLFSSLCLSLTYFIIVLFPFSKIYATECNEEGICFEPQVIIEIAKKYKIVDQSSKFYGCMLQEWEAEFVPEESDLDNSLEVWNVYSYERFLACYRSNSSIGKVGELGVDTETRRVPNGTRFKAKLTCKNKKCTTQWVETICCFNINHEKY